MFASIVAKAISLLRQITESYGQGLSSWLKRRRWFRACYFACTGWHARFAGLPNWPKLLAQDFSSHTRAASADTSELPRILIATGTAGHLPSMTMESFLGVALTHRGASVHYLLCDRTLPACMMCEISWHSDLEDFAANGPCDRCNSCYKPAAAMLAEAHLHQIGLSSQLSASDRKRAREFAQSIALEKIPTYSIDDVPVGEHALAGTLRFFARGDLRGEPYA